MWGMIWSCGDGEKTCRYGDKACGDEDSACGDGAGWEKIYLLLGGDEDKIVSPHHSLLSTRFVYAFK